MSVLSSSTRCNTLSSSLIVPPVPPRRERKAASRNTGSPSELDPQGLRPLNVVVPTRRRPCPASTAVTRSSLSLSARADRLWASSLSTVITRWPPTRITRLDSASTASTVADGTRFSIQMQVTRSTERSATGTRSPSPWTYPTRQPPGGHGQHSERRSSTSRARPWAASSAETIPSLRRCRGSVPRTAPGRRWPQRRPGLARPRRVTRRRDRRLVVVALVHSRLEHEPIVELLGWRSPFDKLRHRLDSSAHRARPFDRPRAPFYVQYSSRCRQRAPSSAVNQDRISAMIAFGYTYLTRPNFDPSGSAGPRPSPTWCADTNRAARPCCRA